MTSGGVRKRALMPGRPKLEAVRMQDAALQYRFQRMQLGDAEQSEVKGRQYGRPSRGPAALMGDASLLLIAYLSIITR